jgi:K+ transporter
LSIGFDFSSELDSQKTQYALVETMKEKLQERVKDLMMNLSQKSEEVKAVKAEFRISKLNSDTLISCYKVQFGFKTQRLKDAFEISNDSIIAVSPG